MKVTISPSVPDEGYATVSIDTGTNDDTTVQIVDAVLTAVIASGHAGGNVIDAVDTWVVEKQMLVEYKKS